MGVEERLFCETFMVMMMFLGWALWVVLIVVDCIVLYLTFFGGLFGLSAVWNHEREMNQVHAVGDGSTDRK